MNFNVVRRILVAVYGLVWSSMVKKPMIFGVTE